MRRFILRHLAVYYMLIASLCFALTGAFAKMLSEQMGSVEVVFWRNLIGLALVVYALAKAPHAKLTHGKGRPLLLIFRGVIGVVALLAFFYNIAHISLAAAFTFSKTSPIFTAIFCFLFLKERISLRGWGGILLGFVGILLIVQPNIGIHKSDLIGIFSGVGGALAYTSVRELRKCYDVKVIVLSFMFFGSLIPFGLMAFGESLQSAFSGAFSFLYAPFVMPDAVGWAQIVAMGVFGAVFQVNLTKAFAASRSAGVIAAVGYTDILFSLLFGVMLGDGLPNLLACAGILVVIIAGVLVSV